MTPEHRVYEALKSNGKVDRGWLGVVLAPVDDETATRLNLPDKRGALVTELSSRTGLPSPAGDAGIRPGDVILRWNGRVVEDSLALTRLVALAAGGEQAEVLLDRRGEQLTIQVTVGKRAPELD